MVHVRKTSLKEYFKSWLKYYIIIQGLLNLKNEL